MFGLGKKSINSEKVDTIIGKGSVFEGIVNAEGTVRLDGMVHGGLNIKGNLIVGGAICDVSIFYKNIQEIGCYLNRFVYFSANYCLHKIPVIQWFSSSSDFM